MYTCIYVHILCFVELHYSADVVAGVSVAWCGLRGSRHVAALRVLFGHLVEPRRGRHVRYYELNLLDAYGDGFDQVRYDRPACG